MSCATHLPHTSIDVAARRDARRLAAARMQSEHISSPSRPAKLYDAAQPGRTLGAPRQHSAQPGAAPQQYTTGGGIVVDVEVADLPEPHGELEALVDALDGARGCLFESSYDFPGRYARWTMGFANPPLVLEAWGRRFCVSALNPRGKVLLPPIQLALRGCDALASLEEAEDGSSLRGVVKPIEGSFTEEERSRQHSIFSIVSRGLFSEQSLSRASLALHL